MQECHIKIHAKRTLSLHDAMTLPDKNASFFPQFDVESGKLFVENFFDVNICGKLREFSTIIVETQTLGITGFAIVFHNFHSPYYYY